MSFWLKEKRRKTTEWTLEVFFIKGQREPKLKPRSVPQRKFFFFLAHLNSRFHQLWKRELVTCMVGERGKLCCYTFETKKKSASHTRHLPFPPIMMLCFAFVSWSEAEFDVIRLVASVEKQKVIRTLMVPFCFSFSLGTFPCCSIIGRFALLSFYWSEWRFRLKHRRLLFYPSLLLSLVFASLESQKGGGHLVDLWVMGDRTF